MGVPRLQLWVKERFGRSFKYYSLNKDSKIKVIDHLFIDANGLLHGAAQRVFQYGVGLDPTVTDLFIDNSHLPYDQKIEIVWELFLEYLLDVINLADPKKSVYIALDGPAPLGKQSQQRQRRFVSPPSDCEFNPNCITPGTKFMHELNIWLNKRLKKFSHRENGEKRVVYFSPSSIPGEGEHKCIEFVRKRKPEGSVALFGPDADLIMLTLSITNVAEHVYLLKQELNDQRKFILMNMTQIGERLRCTVPDFIFLGFFVGNDFLPKVRMFLYLEDGMKEMLRTFDKKRTLIDKNGTVGLNALRVLALRLRSKEIAYLQSQADYAPDDNRFVNHTLNSFIDGNAFDFEGYREKYYQKAGVEESDVGQMCKDYIRTLVWIFKYYTEGVPDWSWLYPWHYAPLMIDLHRTLHKLSVREFSSLCTFNKGKPSTPFLQLSCVLPKQSKELLPEEFHHLLSSNEDVEIDYEGVTAEYMSTILVPFPDMDNIRSEYEEALKTVSEEDSKRNLLRTTLYKK